MAWNVLLKRGFASLFKASRSKMCIRISVRHVHRPPRRIKESFMPHSVFSKKITTFRSTSNYIQGDNILPDAAMYLKEIVSSKKCGVVIGKKTKSILEKDLSQSFEKHNVDLVWLDFNGESSYEEAERLYNLCKYDNVDCIMSVGGGKCIDVGKVVADYLEHQFVSFPSIASNDGACSDVSVMYTPDHQVLDLYYLRTNPVLVLVDNNVLISAPIKYLIAGMGDALATYYEARSAQKKGLMNWDGGNQTLSSMALSKLCSQILMDHGANAVQAAKDKTINDSFKSIVEANVLLSALGFQNCGTSTAHSVAQSICSDEYVYQHYMHGEHVSVGTVVQLLVEEDQVEAIKVAKWCKEVGLPYCCKHVGFDPHVSDKDEDLNKVLELTINTWSDGKVTKEMMLNAMRFSDHIVTLI